MVCVNLSLWRPFKTESLVSSRYVISGHSTCFPMLAGMPHFRLKSQSLLLPWRSLWELLNRCWEFPREPYELQLSISHTGSKWHNPHESIPVRHRFNSLFLCDSTNKGRQIKNNLKSICHLKVIPSDYELWLIKCFIGSYLPDLNFLLSFCNHKL